MKLGKNFRGTLSFHQNVENNKNGGIRVASRGRRNREATDLFPERSPSLTLCSSSDSSQDMSTGYTLGDHMEYLHIRKDTIGNYYSDVTYLLCASSMSNLIHDFCHPIPTAQLRTLYAGLEDSKRSDSPETADPEPLPIRTLSIRLRPDVMTAVVLDALQEACEMQPDQSVQVLRRHQGQYRCILFSASDDGDSANRPLILDATVCTKRTGVLERILLLRIFHVGGQNPKHKKRTSTQRHGDILKMVGAEENMVPINLHLRASSAFLQHLSKHSDSPSAVAAKASPKSSPKASSAHFLANYDPSISVQLRKELPHFPVNRIFPSLNSDDWALLQSSWTLISIIWRRLTTRKCSFHTILEDPIFDEKDNKRNNAILDLHYCAQVRQIARERMLVELESNFDEIRSNLKSMEKTYHNFVETLQEAWSNYQMASFKLHTMKPPELKLPSTIPPPGYMEIAGFACRCSEPTSLSPASRCDDAVSKVYKTFCSQDDHASRKHMKDANAVVMDRLVNLQKKQIEFVQELERHKNTQNAGRAFCKIARNAINSKGRVERFILARVPVLDLKSGGTRCRITATNMLCTNESLFGNKCHLFDLKAIDFQVLSDTSLAVVTDDSSREVLYKMSTKSDIHSVIEFLKTLQTLQSVFERKSKQPKASTRRKSEESSEIA